MTYREIVYAVLDLLKLRSDDAYYTEEHIIFLVQKMRALLLERKYRGSRNQAYTAVDEENIQHICVPLETATVLPGGCGGNWLKSVNRVPKFMGIYEPVLASGNDMLHSMLSFIPPERMPYVGHNKWLKNIIYASVSMTGYLYATSNNEGFMFLERLGMNGVFSDPEKASEYSCDEDDMNNCDILDKPFPLEQSLVIPCIEMVVQEIAGPRYQPEDKSNNAKDDLSSVGIMNRRRLQRDRRSNDDETEEE